MRSIMKTPFLIFPFLFSNFLCSNKNIPACYGSKRTETPTPQSEKIVIDLYDDHYETTVDFTFYNKEEKRNQNEVITKKFKHYATYTLNPRKLDFYEASKQIKILTEKLDLYLNNYSTKYTIQKSQLDLIQTSRESYEYHAKDQSTDNTCTFYLTEKNTNKE